MYEDSVQQSESGSRQTGTGIKFDYDEIAENCIRYLGINDFDRIDHLSLKEYNILMQAHNLRSVDKSLEQHTQAWLNVAAGAMKQQGKNKQVPVYKSFKKFFDYEAEIAKVRGEKESQFADLSKHLKEKHSND